MRQNRERKKEGETFASLKPKSETYILKQVSYIEKDVLRCKSPATATRRTHQSTATTTTNASTDHPEVAYVDSYRYRRAGQTISCKPPPPTTTTTTITATTTTVTTANGTRTRRRAREEEKQRARQHLCIRQRWHYPETGMTPLASRCDETTTLLLLLLLELAPGARCYSRAAATTASSLPR